MQGVDEPYIPEDGKLRRNYYVHLLTAAVELLQKIFVSIYLNGRYPYLKDKDTEKTHAFSVGIWPLEDLIMY